MDPISMDTATSPTNPDPRFPRPPPSPLRQRATHRGIRARRATEIVRAYQRAYGQAHEARRRRGDGTLASSWPATGGDVPARASAGTVLCAGRIGVGRPLTGRGSGGARRVRTTGARSRTRIRRWECGRAGGRGRASPTVVGWCRTAGSVASSWCRGSRCQPQASGLTILIFYLLKI